MLINRREQGGQSGRMEASGPPTSTAALPLGHTSARRVVSLYMYCSQPQKKLLDLTKQWADKFFLNLWSHLDPFICSHKMYLPLNIFLRMFLHLLPHPLLETSVVPFFLMSSFSLLHWFFYLQITDFLKIHQSYDDSGWR